MTSQFIELAIARHFGHRTHLIVPNVYWGFGLNYEADLIVVSQSGYATEVEIKVTRSDIKAEQRKHRMAHNSLKIKRFFYAVPEEIADCEWLPRDAGLFSVDKDWQVKTLRAPRINKDARRLHDHEWRQLQTLAAMRIWDLKETIARLQDRLK